MPAGDRTDPGEEGAAAEDVPEVVRRFLGDESFPIEWRAGKQELFRIHDDLHCPNPLSPMFFDIAGWRLTRDHMFRRFGTPLACDCIAKLINGCLYTAAAPADPKVNAESPARKSQRARLASPAHSPLAFKVRGAVQPLRHANAQKATLSPPLSDKISRASAGVAMARPSPSMIWRAERTC
jgi:hypothetical protein